MYDATMSDSDGDLSTPTNIPADSDIEQCLRRIVRDAVKKDEEISVNLARSRTEVELGLDSGFFKNNDHWKQKSKELINGAVEEPESPERPKKGAPKPKAGTKRKSDEPPSESKKKVKKSPVDGSDEKDELLVPESEPAKQRESSVLPKSEEESALSEPPDEDSEAAATKENGKPAADDYESDMSSLIDDPPPKKKGRQKKSSSPTATTKSKKSAKAAKSDKSAKELSPDEEEIKRLQSWLLKCGIRKLWHRELAPYQTSKEKIRHLKKMLEDVGMTGRYSAEKARSIKEARELKAELESAKEFSKQWGHEEDETEEKDTGVRRGLKPKGLVDFGDSGEESE